MTGLTLLMGPIAALIGVWIGGVLSSRTQRKTWQREQVRREQDAIRAACAGYVAAARRFASYVKDLNTEITVVPHPGLGGPIHVVQDPSFRLELESASADLLDERLAELRAAEAAFINAARAELGALPLASGLYTLD